MRPSGLNLIVTSILRSSGLAPGGGLHKLLTRALKASISLCDSFAAVPLGAPRLTASLVSPVAARRCGVCLLSSAATCLGSNLGCCSCSFFGGVGVLASTFFGSGFFASSFVIASATRSGFGSAG